MEKTKLRIPLECLLQEWRSQADHLSLKAVFRRNDGDPSSDWLPLQVRADEIRQKCDSLARLLKERKPLRERETPRGFQKVAGCDETAQPAPRVAPSLSCEPPTINLQREPRANFSKPPKPTGKPMPTEPKSPPKIHPEHPFKELLEEISEPNLDLWQCPTRVFWELCRLVAWWKSLELTPQMWIVADNVFRETILRRKTSALLTWDEFCTGTWDPQTEKVMSWGCGLSQQEAVDAVMELREMGLLEASPWSSPGGDLKGTLFKLNLHWMPEEFPLPMDAHRPPEQRTKSMDAPHPQLS